MPFLHLLGKFNVQFLFDKSIAVVYGVVNRFAVQLLGEHRCHGKIRDVIEYLEFIAAEVAFRQVCINIRRLLNIDRGICRSVLRGICTRR